MALKLKQRCMDLEREGLSKDSSIENLLRAQTQIMQEMDQCQRELEGQKALVGTLGRSLQEKDQQIVEFVDKVHEQEKEIQRLVSRLNSKDEEIASERDKRNAQHRMLLVQEKAMASAFHEVSLEMHKTLRNHRMQCSKVSWLSEERSKLN